MAKYHPDNGDSMSMENYNDSMNADTTISSQDQKLEGYTELLRQHNLSYRKVDEHYLQVGDIERTQGWILHVSVIKPQLPQLLSILIPELVQENVPFKIARNKDIAGWLLEGDLGYVRLGKVICIYPENEERGAQIARKLIALTLPFRGPEIPTDIHLGGTVYTRFGSFNPVIKENAVGQPERFIYDIQGNLIKDQYVIPFKLASGMRWPFISVLVNPLPAPIHRKHSLLKDSYLITENLKADAKGSVFKAIRLKGLLPQTCIIKEGRHDMCVDDQQRDMSDRLRWQYKLQQALHPDLPVPKAYHFFEEKGNTYLVMEYIKGTFLRQVLKDIYQNGSWHMLTRANKLRLLDYLLQLVSHMEKLHAKGFVHRDFTPVNFILDKNDRLAMIDLELSYSFNEETPYPPFGLGTEGFMSPEQKRMHVPTVKEDIYGLAATMVTFFTNLYPERFDTSNRTRLEEAMRFFMGDADVARLTAQCLTQRPHERPELDEMKSVILAFRDKVLDWSSEVSQPRDIEIDPDKIKEIIQGGLRALNSPIFCNAEGIWYSNVMENQMYVDTPQNGRTHYMGLHTGISGVLYAIAKANEAGIDVSEVMPAYQRNYEHMRDKFLAKLPSLAGGLYFGTYGVAVALAEGIKQGLIRDDIVKTKVIINSCLSVPCHSLDLAGGTAGQGLAILHCLSYLEENAAQELLRGSLSSALITQQKDGSWIHQGTKWTGLSKGTAGVVIFLIEYYKRFKEPPVKDAIEKGLSFLHSKAIMQTDRIVWPLYDKNSAIDLWFCEGAAGIALCLTRAYHLLGNEVYKQLAEGALLNYSEQIINSNLSLAQGIGGLGEVYLEAARVFKNRDWQRRVEWNTMLLAYTNCRYTDRTCYWTVENNKIATADLMVGNSGLQYFFLNQC